MFSCEICALFKNTYFTEYIPVAAFVFSETKKEKWKNILI